MPASSFGLFSSPFQTKLTFNILLLIAIWIVSRRDDVSIWEALQVHEPSWRVFRSLLEVTLAFAGVAVSLQVWLSNPKIGKETVTRLLFAPPTNEDDDHKVRVAGDDGDDDDDDDYDEAEEEDEFREIEPLNSPGKAGGEQDKKRLRKKKTEEGCLPEPVQVWTAVLDMTLWILLALFFYVVAAGEILTNHASSYVQIFSMIAAPAFPLVLFGSFCVWTVFPWKRKRQVFWWVLYQTLAAPFAPVTFRDGFVGDILTSTVRPMQDIFFTLFYLLSGLQGWWSVYHASLGAGGGGGSDAASTTEEANTTFLGQADASVVPALERSWLLHTILLPMCMVSPLWMRFMQNLRQTYEAKQRWPFLGNALKYFVAAQVAMVGVWHPHSSRKSILWISSFVLATCYQIWWDIVMDWGLLEKSSTSSQWQLRSRRLYQRKSTYYAIATINILLRFCWTLSFVPPRYLTQSGHLQDNFISLLGPFIASAEIVRRTMWGWLRLEWEAVKQLPFEPQPLAAAAETAAAVAVGIDPEKTLELTPMKVVGRPGEGSVMDDDDGEFGRLTSTSSNNKTPLQAFSDMSSMNDVQVLAELSAYSGIFALLGLVFAAHRGTM